jgi:hypothetical protein
MICSLLMIVSSALGTRRNRLQRITSSSCIFSWFQGFVWLLVLTKIITTVAHKLCIYTTRWRIICTKLKNFSFHLPLFCRNLYSIFQLDMFQFSCRELYTTTVLLVYVKAIHIPVVFICYHYWQGSSVQLINVKRSLIETSLN